MILSSTGSITSWNRDTKATQEYLQKQIDFQTKPINIKGLNVTDPEAKAFILESQRAGKSDDEIVDILRGYNIEKKSKNKEYDPTFFQPTQEEAEYEAQRASFDETDQKMMQWQQNREQKELEESKGFLTRFFDDGEKRYDYFKNRRDQQIEMKKAEGEWDLGDAIVNRLDTALVGFGATSLGTLRAFSVDLDETAKGLASLVVWTTSNLVENTYGKVFSYEPGQYNLMADEVYKSMKESLTPEALARQMYEDPISLILVATQGTKTAASLWKKVKNVKNLNLTVPSMWSLLGKYSKYEKVGDDLLKQKKFVDADKDYVVDSLTKMRDKLMEERIKPELQNIRQKADINVEGSSDLVYDTAKIARGLNGFTTLNKNGKITSQITKKTTPYQLQKLIDEKLQKTGGELSQVLKDKGSFSVTDLEVGLGTKLDDLLGEYRSMYQVFEEKDHLPFAKLSQEVKNGSVNFETVSSFLKKYRREADVYATRRGTADVLKKSGEDVEALHNKGMNLIKERLSDADRVKFNALNEIYGDTAYTRKIVNDIEKLSAKSFVQEFQTSFFTVGGLTSAVVGGALGFGAGWILWGVLLPLWISTGLAAKKFLANRSGRVLLRTKTNGTILDNIESAQDLLAVKDLVKAIDVNSPLDLEGYSKAERLLNKSAVGQKLYKEDPEGYAKLSEYYKNQNKLYKEKQAADGDIGSDNIEIVEDMVKVKGTDVDISTIENLDKVFRDDKKSPAYMAAKRAIIGQNYKKYVDGMSTLNEPAEAFNLVDNYLTSIGKELLAGEEIEILLKTLDGKVKLRDLDKLEMRIKGAVNDKDLERVRKWKKEKEDGIKSVYADTNKPISQFIESEGIWKNPEDISFLLNYLKENTQYLDEAKLQKIEGIVLELNDEKTLKGFKGLMDKFTEKKRIDLRELEKQDYIKNWDVDTAISLAEDAPEFMLENLKKEFILKKGNLYKYNTKDSKEILELMSMKLTDEKSLTSIREMIIEIEEVDQLRKLSKDGILIDVLNPADRKLEKNILALKEKFKGTEFDKELEGKITYKNLDKIMGKGGEDKELAARRLEIQEQNAEIQRLKIENKRELEAQKLEREKIKLEAEKERSKSKKELAEKRMEAEKLKGEIKTELADKKIEAEKIKSETPKKVVDKKTEDTTPEEEIPKDTTPDEEIPKDTTPEDTTPKVIKEEETKIEFPEEEVFTEPFKRNSKDEYLIPFRENSDIKSSITRMGNIGDIAKRFVIDVKSYLRKPMEYTKDIEDVIRYKDMGYDELRGWTHTRNLMKASGITKNILDNIEDLPESNKKFLMKFIK